MIPQGTRTGQLQIAAPRQQPSRTYRINSNLTRIVGKVDGLDAVKQAVAKILRTERYQYLIYSFNYGSELKGLTGSERLYAQSEIVRRIKEALKQDDRVQEVDRFEWEFTVDGVTVRFTVHSSYGQFEVNQEVEQNV